MLERLLEQKRAIVVYSQENDISTLTANQRNIADKVVKTLRPFQQQAKEPSVFSNFRNDRHVTTTESAEDYYRQTLDIAFLDCIITQFDERFPSHKNTAIRLNHYCQLT